MKCYMNISSAIVRSNMQKLNNTIKATNKTQSKKDINAAVNDETLKKMREIAYKDAKNDIRGSSEYVEFLHKCREKVAPDRSKSFELAEQKMEQSFQMMNKSQRTGTIWDYLLYVNGELEDGNSINGQLSPDGSQFIEVKDENGELIGHYSSSTGWNSVWNSTERQCLDMLCTEYNNAFMECWNSVHNGSKAERELVQGLDIKV